MTIAYQPLSGGITPAQLQEFEDTQNVTDPELQATLDATDPQTPPAEPNDPYEKRYWDLKKHHDNKITDERRRAEEAEKRAAELEAKLAKQNSYATDDAVQKFETEYEVAPVIKEMIARVSDDRVKKALEQSEAERRKELAGVARLQAAHPDYQALDKDPVFNEWLNDQTVANAGFKRMVEQAQKGDFDCAILIFNMFKAQAVVKKPSGQDKKETSKAPITSSPAELPNQKKLVSFSEWQKKFDRAEKSRNLDLQQKLLDELSLADKEGRLTS